MNLEQTVAREQETYPDERKKNGNRAKGSLGWCDRRDFLCKVGVLDSRVQCRGGTLPPLMSSVIGFHGRNSRESCGVKATRRIPKLEG